MVFPSHWRPISIGKLRWFWVDDRFDYAGLRMIALAPETDILYDVAFVDRAERRRIISLRRANRREANHYAENI